MPATKILFLGATGYLGGTVLDALLKHRQVAQFEIVTFFRSEEKALKAAALGLQTISGELSALEEAASNASVIFNCASADDVLLNETILAGAKKAYTSTEVAPILIHTSGSAVVADNAMGQYASENIYDDADETLFDALPATQLHRNVDLLLAAAHKEGYVRAYVLAPPLIYGQATGKFVDAGLQNPVPTALLLISRVAMGRGTFGRLGPANNVWSTIEIHDLTTLFLAIFDALLDGIELAGGNAYYTAVDGELVIAEFSSKVADALHEVGVLKTAEVTEVTNDDVVKWPVLVAFGANSRLKDSRSRSLGWRPMHKSSAFLVSIRESIQVMVNQREKFGGDWPR